MDTDTYIGNITGPSGFGPAKTTFADSGTGDYVLLAANAPFFELPVGYISDTALSDTATFVNATFASLGVTPGTYVWTWGSAANPTANSFTLVIGTPLPAALPLFATGLGALGLLGWRRKLNAVAPSH